MIPRVTILALMTSACAPAPYWVKVAEPIPLRELSYVEIPCGREDWLGCTHMVTGDVELRKGLSFSMHECVMSHERRHLAGWIHDARPLFAYDCGDGTIHP